MNKLQNDLRIARPSLKQVTPLSFMVILILAIFNLVLGLALMFAIDSNQSRLSAPLIIVNDLLTFQFWGAVFIGIGLVKLFALKTNNWKLSRQSLLLGAGVKAMWAVALIFRVFISPGSVFLSLLWITIAALQMACYVFFMPPSTQSYKQTKKERDE